MILLAVYFFSLQRNPSLTQNDVRVFVIMQIACIVSEQNSKSEDERGREQAIQYQLIL